MIDLDMAALVTAVALSEPLNIRTIAFDIPTFDLLKSFQRRLDGLIRNDRDNAEILKYLIHIHPRVRVAP